MSNLAFETKFQELCCNFQVNIFVPKSCWKDEQVQTVKTAKKTLSFSKVTQWLISGSLPQRLSHISLPRTSLSPSPSLSSRHSLKTRSSLMSLMTNQSPAGKTQLRMCRSKKNATHVVGWCSETDAMIGMCSFA